ncbi:hypothetical protein ACHAW5_002883 [Stephanodiscus triporus]|uniref:Transmembrane protein n=1 Tax=Stephanodiscus triporus TaxID=2934178 RepID=A0ABD3MSP9_9STRA
MASIYRRVAQNEDSAEETIVGNDSSRTPAAATTTTTTTTAPRSRSERISEKVHALAWVVVSYAVATYTHLFHTIFADERILRPSLYVSIFLFASNVILTAYLTVYLPYKFPTSDKYVTRASSPKFWEAYCPNVIPTMTAFGVIGSFFLCRACFPVWGFLTPLILGVVALGMFFSLHFIPVFG